MHDTAQVNMHTAEVADPIRVATLLIGPRPARRAARGLLRGADVVEHGSFDSLPAGPAVCIDARRLVFVSAGGIDLLGAAVSAGAAVALPGTNGAPWPLCGNVPPRPAARVADLDEHADAIASLPTVELGTLIDLQNDPGLPLPAVFAVADASSLSGRVERLGDLLVADSIAPARIDLVQSVWCHHRNVPLVTLSMIVKNEAERITGAIALARGLADEVVVYDTGSTDDTVALARAAGARVQIGYWDDDFSRARNEAISMVRGDWVLILDGDDELVATPEECIGLRRVLASLDDRHALELRVRNLDNAVIGQVSSGTMSRRLFSRTLRYRNRVHEVPELPGGGDPVGLQVTGPWIRHTGYLGDQDERIDRNLRLAQQRVDEAPDLAHRAAAMFEYGRGLMKAERYDEAGEAFAEAVRDAGTDEVRDIATLLWANMLALVGDNDRAEEMCRAVLSRSRGPACDAARWILSTVVPTEAAIDLLDQLESVEFMLITATPDEVRTARAYLCACCDRFDEATQVLATVDHPHIHRFAWLTAALAVSAGHLDAASSLIDTVSADDLLHAVGALAEGPSIGGHVMATALWDHFPAHPTLIAYFGSGSARGGFLTAMEARSLLAEVDALHVDPLQDLLDHPWGDEADQMLAALVLDELAGTTDRVAAVAATVADDLVDDVLGAVGSLLPELLAVAAASLGKSVAPLP
ncbi:MAG: glycosyltransferase family 2 protein [Ilumatobacteraceae bacterium]